MKYMLSFYILPFFIMDVCIRVVEMFPLWLGEVISPHIAVVPASLCGYSV